MSKPTEIGHYPFRWHSGQAWSVVMVFESQVQPYALHAWNSMCFSAPSGHVPLATIRDDAQWGKRIPIEEYVPPPKRAKNVGAK